MWNTVLTGLPEQFCQKSGNFLPDVRNKFRKHFSVEKTLFFSEILSHVNCSFDSIVEKVSSKNCQFFARSPKSTIFFIFFLKEITTKIIPLDLWIVVLTSLSQIFRWKSENTFFKIRRQV